MDPRPVAPQLAIFCLALVLAALSGAATLAGLVAAYAAAWMMLNVVRVRGLALPTLSPRALGAVTLLVVASPLATLWARREQFVVAESLVGLDEHLVDRLRLERSPAIHPALVVGDRPQTFFVHAGDAHRVCVTLAAGVATIEAEPLGHGLFRADYDPRRDGAPRATGVMQARIDVDGAVAERGVRVVLPPAHPRWLHASPDRTRACTTSEETDELVIVDAAGLVARAHTDDGPTDCAFAGASGDTIAVTHRYATDLALARRDGTIAARVDLGAGQGRVVASQDGRLVAVALETRAGDVAVVDVASRRVLGRGVVGGTADWLVFGTAARSLVVARRTPAALVRFALDAPAGALRRDRERALLAPAVTMTALDDGARIALATTDWADDAAPHRGNHFVQDQLLVVDTQTLALVAQLPTARRSPRQDAAGDVDRGVSPMGIDVLADGHWLVAFAGSDELTRWDPAGGEPRSFDVARLGLSAPHSVVALVGGTLAATSPSSGRVALLDARSGRARAMIALAPDDATLLRERPDELQRRFGERAFYEGTRAGVSCQSCHLHGGSDGMAHNIGGRVLAPTLDTRGVGGTSPYLRDGSYPRISDLHEVAEQRYRGYREPAGDRAATLDAWIAAQPLPRVLTPRDPAAERRGLDVFVRAGCPTCHAFPAMTNLGRHPVHTVFPRARAARGASLDTPSLRGVSRRTRWLFDGRAASLAAIFRRHNPDDRHGHTRGLAPSSLADLVHFLESL